MKKHWTKSTDSQFTLWVDNKETGKMNIRLNSASGKASCMLNGKALEIKRTGFWKSKIEITDSNGLVLVKTYPENWYGKNSTIEFAGKTYKLLIRNNPLAEFAISENDKIILAYGLSAKNKITATSISTQGNPDLVFDLLLWYLFYPVATENTAGDFLVLTAVGD